MVAKESDGWLKALGIEPPTRCATRWKQANKKHLFLKEMGEEARREYEVANRGQLCLRLSRFCTGEYILH
jgi:hypothetical protein